MIGLKIAVQTRSLGQPLKQALHTAGKFGCDGVQIDARTELRPNELSDTGLRQVRKMLDDLNLRVASATFASRRGYAAAEDLEPRLRATVDAIRMTSRLGARVLVIAAGDLPATDDAQRTTFVEAVESLAAQGSRLGVQLALQCPEATPASLAALFDELPDGLVGVDFNPADLIRAGSSPREFLAALGRRIIHVYANDAVRGLGGAAAIDVELGRGSAHFPELLAALEEFEYRGWATVSRRDGPRPIEDCANAVAFLRAL